MPTNSPFRFFAPAASAVAAPALSVFPKAITTTDFSSLQKNIPQFLELAGQFGLNKTKEAILKNTMQFSAVRLPENVNDSPLKNLGNSILGFPVFSNLIIRGGNYSNNAGVVIGEYPDIRLDAVIMSVDKEPNRIVTDIQGRDRSVIEYLSRKSKIINIKGRIVSNTRGAYPYRGVQDLSYALDSNKSLIVDSWYLQMLGIYNVSPGKLSLPQEEGSMEYQLFEFDAIEDAPILLKIQK